MHRRTWMALALLVLFCTGWTAALDNGLGKTPPMGFNTWNYFGCDINEAIARTTAEKMISLGLADAGYRYLNLDDCWAQHSRDSTTGNLKPDPFKFPSGMKALADDIHAKGLLVGIYADSGLLTCAGFPGSRFHEVADAQLFASWGIDYLKYDNCFAPASDVQQRYQAMRDALNSTGRQIYFSMCEWGVNEPWRWGASVGNSWRTDADIDPSWAAILRSLDNGAAGLARFTGPGGWNDPDMLEVGNGQLSIAQQRSHFALWALVKAPLLIGANLDTISATSLAILKAREVIAINQDPLGVAGDIIWKEGPAEVWAGPLANGARAVILFNRHWVGDPVTLSVTWEQLGILGAAGGCVKAAVRDLYANKDLGVFEGGYTSQVNSNDVAVLRVQPLSDTAGCDNRSAMSTSTSRLRSLMPWRGGSSSDNGAGAGRAHTLEQLQPAFHRMFDWFRSWRKQHQQQQQQVRGLQLQVRASDDSGWRPWHGAEAAELQARLRDAARADRQQRWSQQQQQRLGRLSV